MTINNHYCRICGAKFQAEKKISDPVCTVCAGLKAEPLTRHFAEACEVRKVQREFERPLVSSEVKR